MMELKEIDELIKAVSKFPGLGPKSAKRIILKLINNKNEIKYSYNENILEFKSIDNKVDKLLLNGKINKKPF